MRSSQFWALLRFSLTALFLYGIWFIFSWDSGPFSLVAGAIAACAVAWITYDSFLASHEASLNSFLPNPFYLAIYTLILTVELYRSSFRMLAALFTGDINPRVVYMKTRMKSDTGRFLLANSITLTPGTICLDLDDDHLTVHWMFCDTVNARAAGESVKGSLERKLRRVIS